MPQATVHCSWCSSRVDIGVRVCRGCNADVVYTATRREKVAAFKWGLLLGFVPVREGENVEAAGEVKEAKGEKMQKDAARLDKKAKAKAAAAKEMERAGDKIEKAGTEVEKKK
jgi:hypothetical protein